ncbi:helix-turn-helix domain-containing protein [Streptomyces sulphureus]|uniref:helix-turn-helix domain-containing protein n=1 Tax=Streptomyces sulphureus TaxID=47758 RepID=UPI000380DDB0|nr:helix-turn-helix transcriptional regulator [Streptomyces sulphureus]
MAGLQEERTGTRIAEQRKLAGLTQRGLAQRIPYSYSMLRQVEEGHKNASPDLVAAVAHALRIDVTTLTGQPYLAELRQDRLAELIRPIRECLDLYDLEPSAAYEVRPVAELAHDADDLCRLVRATQLNTAARALPPLVTEVTAAAHRAPGTHVWQTLGSCYRTAYDLATKLGFHDLSTIALDRMAWAAERAGDPLLAAVRQYMRALAYFREGEHGVGLRLIGKGHLLLEGAEHESGAAACELRAVQGQLHLGAAIIAARARDADTVRARLAEARTCAQHTGEAGWVHWLSFGPANVAAHELSAHVEMNRYGKALQAASRLQLPHGWAMSRRAHVHIDRARCEMETGRTEAALDSLITARRMAPQQTRYHPGARETLKGLLQQRRRTPGTLGHMAAWIGM